MDGGDGMDNGGDGIGDGINDDWFIGGFEAEDCDDNKYSKYHWIIQQIMIAIPNANNIYSVFEGIVSKLLFFWKNDGALSYYLVLFYFI